MEQSARHHDTIFRLSPKIHLLPFLHGSGDMAQEIREMLILRRFDCVAVPLPPSVEAAVRQGIRLLPNISLAALPEPTESDMPEYSFVPIDPCQPVIMAIRVAMGEGIEVAFLDRDVASFEPRVFPMPDPYALKQVSLASFSTAVLPFLPYPKPDSQHWHRITWMGFKLHELELEFRSILCLCSIEDWAWVREAYERQPIYTPPESVDGHPSLYRVAPHTLYFTLCELPFVTEQYERCRLEARSDQHVSIDGIKELLLEARSRWLAKRPRGIIQERNWVTPQLLQMYLQYVRNLSLQEHRLTPDLYTLVVAAQQMAGDDFAVTVLETAKTYALSDEPGWQPSLPDVSVGIDRLEFADGKIARAKNRLQGSPLTWRSLSLRPTPPPPKKRQWAFRWNPFGQCSWPREDERIEGFAAHVRDQARQILGSELARVEKFTTSFRDGIDLRTTIRHWKGGGAIRAQDIFVRHVPPSHGQIEIIVFLFELPADPDKYRWQTTWYAEHQEESTLCFFATPFLENMVGPGIGQSVYGGAFFLFPPRPIPNVWQDARFNFAQTLDERLLAGAFAHSQCPHVVVVSPVPPRAQWRRLAKRYARQLIPIPLSRFSGQAISRLRHFHVLNGHEIRSYAAQFIRD